MFSASNDSEDTCACERIEIASKAAKKVMWLHPRSSSNTELRLCKART
jgi:hypothetical protein